MSFEEKDLRKPSLSETGRKSVMDANLKRVLEGLRKDIDRANQILATRKEALDDRLDDLRASREFNDRVSELLDMLENA